LNIELHVRDAQHYDVVINGRLKLNNLKYGTPIATRAGVIFIEKTKFANKILPDDDYIIDIQPIDLVVQYLDKLIELEMPDSKDKASDLVNISVKGPLIDKSMAIIWAMINEHRKEKIQDQNQIARNTSDFINERMTFLTEELGDVEKNAERFKSQHQIVDVLTDGQSFVGKRDELEKEIIIQSVQLNLIQYLRDYLKNQQEIADLLPANLGFEDASIVAIAQQYNKLVLDRISLIKSSSAKNPTILKIDDQLEGLRHSLTEGLKSNESKIRIALKALNAQVAKYEGRIASVPGFEREFRDIERQQKIKETLYIFLLQKREENEIKTAAAIGNTKIIMEPNSDGVPISPKSNIIYLAALLLGLALPVAYLYVRQLLDTKVHGLQDLVKTRIPALGEIPLAQDMERNIVATKNARTHIAESFRMARTNLSFLLGEQKQGSQVILVTSSVAKEGKSFISINIGHTLAHGNKKTLVIGLDLRAPKIGRYVDISKSIGVTNYLVSEDIQFDDLLTPDPGNGDLDYIISGDIPPNPSELLMRERLTTLIEEAKSRYDYIVLDTAPVGLVSDSMHLAKFADLVIYVVRAELIEKSMLSLPASLYHHKKFPNMTVLVNGVDYKQAAYGYGYGSGYGSNYGYGYGYGYGSGYGYGYGAGYGNDYLEENKTPASRFTKILKSLSGVLSFKKKRKGKKRS
jgi:capsular exopolysaccharide synthesis family protein